MTLSRFRLSVGAEEQADRRSRAAIVVSLSFFAPQCKVVADGRVISSGAKNLCHESMGSCSRRTLARDAFQDIARAPRYLCQLSTTVQR